MEAQAQDMPSTAPNGNGAHVADPPAADVPRETTDEISLPRTLAADIVTTVVNEARKADKAWSQMVEWERDKFKEAVLETVKWSLRRATPIIAGQGFRAAAFTVGDWDKKKGIITAKISASFTDNREFAHDLLDYEGAGVLVLADPKHFFHERPKAPPKEKPAQADIEDVRPPIDTLTDDELAKLMGGEPLRPSYTWFFTKEELAAEHMRRAATDADGNPLAADPETGEIIDTNTETLAEATAPQAPAEASDEGEGAAAAPTAPSPKRRRKKGEGEPSYAETLRSDTRGDEHIRQNRAGSPADHASEGIPEFLRRDRPPSQSDKARRALDDVGEL
jgi:hypothetical protein